VFPPWLSLFPHGWIARNMTTSDQFLLLFAPTRSMEFCLISTRRIPLHSLSKSAFDICQKAGLRVIGNHLANVTLLLKLLGFVSMVSEVHNSTYCT
jgi:hypothetical protein